MSTKVITGKNTRFSYLHVTEPQAINDGTPKYSVSLIVPKSDKVTVDKLKKAIDEAYMEGEAKLRGNAKSVPPLKAIKTPLRDGDLERPDDPAYENSYFLNANSTTKPGVVDGNNQPVLDASELYSGIYGRASISFYAFNRELALSLEQPLEEIYSDVKLRVSISTNASRADKEGELQRLMSMLQLPIAQMIFSNLQPDQVVLAVRYLMAKAELHDADNLLELIDTDTGEPNLPDTPVDESVQNNDDNNV